MLRNHLKSLQGIHLPMGFVIATSAIFIAFEWENSDPRFAQPVLPEVVHTFIAEDLPITYPEKKQVQAPPPQKAPEYNLDEIIEDTQPVKETEVNRMDESDIQPPRKEVVLIDMPEGMGEEDENVPIYGAEVMPEFPGGINALQRFLRKQLNYPHLAQEHDIQGTVYVRFVVTKTGKVENIEIYRGVHTALDAEAIRVVENMPSWKPGSQRGKPVAVYFVLPIKFVLSR